MPSNNRVRILKKAQINWAFFIMSGFCVWITINFSIFVSLYYKTKK